MYKKSDAIRNMIVAVVIIFVFVGSFLVIHYIRERSVEKDIADHFGNAELSNAEVTEYSSRILGLSNGEIENTEEEDEDLDHRMLKNYERYIYDANRSIEDVKILLDEGKEINLEEQKEFQLACNYLAVYMGLYFDKEHEIIINASSYLGTDSSIHEGILNGIKERINEKGNELLESVSVVVDNEIRNYSEQWNTVFENVDALYGEFTAWRDAKSDIL